MAECESCKTKEVTITKEIIDGSMETIRNLYLADDIPRVIGYSSLHLLRLRFLLFFCVRLPLFIGVFLLFSSVTL